MNIALIGADGQLGTDIYRYFTDRGLRVNPLTEKEIDVCDEKICGNTLLQMKPDIIINTAAFHQVDVCEDEVDKAFAVNVRGVKNLSEICLKTGSILMHFSTDFVFGGYEKDTPYTEGDCPAPVSVYGISKLAGEYVIKYMLEEHIELKEGDTAPDFCLPDKDNKEICLKDFKGKYTIIYFYPKDNTPGCTTEAIGFTGILPEFQKLNAEVIGISPDSPESHAKFIEKKNLKVTLLSDEGHDVLKKWGVWGLRNFGGKNYMGVSRSTYLINPEGKIVHTWPKVSVKGHPEEVKQVLEDLLK